MFGVEAVPAVAFLLLLGTVRESPRWPFAVFAVLMVGQLLWVLYVMPETKGVPLERMRDRLNMPLPGERTSAATA